ncbi:MAG TPA: DEAD/DEAH box helicase [Nitrospira sp.]|nr:DEAD/DEAH box helicase [Nitrospira sp.]
MQIKLRSYQSEAVDCHYAFFRENAKGNPIIAMPTGTGKSLVIAGFLESIYKTWPNQKVLVITHVKELIRQNYLKLIALWPTAPAGIYSASLNRRDTLQKIVFCGIASVAKRAHEFGHVDLVLIDEAHLVSPTEDTMYRKFLAELTNVNPHMRVIGYTATKWRLGHGDITEGEDGIFTHTAFDITGIESFNRLIAEGYLAPLVPKKTNFLLEVDGLHMRGGEFIPAELQTAFNKDEITERALREVIETCGDRKKWLIFAAGVEHAVSIAELLDHMGIPCAAVHSQISDKERDQALRDLHTGKLRAVVNNNILTTGYDEPGIDLIIVLRPTASSVLWVQMLGRGTRPCPDEGKIDCRVMDFAGNTRRLGPINDPVIPRKKGMKGGTAPVKECPMCNTLVHASLRFCNGTKWDDTKCEYEFPIQTKITMEASTEDVVKGDLPVVERFPVEHITFSLYKKEGKPDSIRVTYYSGLKNYSEYVCLEHAGYASHKARQWMRERMPDKSLEAPAATLRALEYASNLKVPSAIRVWTNRKYPEILSYEWEENDIAQVTIQGVDHSRMAPPRQMFEVPQPENAYLDDDIPF